MSMGDSGGNRGKGYKAGENGPEIEAVDWREQVDHQNSVLADAPLEQVHHKFRREGLRYLAIIDKGRPIGLCSGRQIGLQLGSQYGFSLYAKIPVRDFRLPDPLIIRVNEPPETVLQQVFSRSGERFNEDVLLVDERGVFLGLISVQTLIRLQNRLLLKSIQHLQEQEAEICRHNRRMTEDLLMAREMQTAMLPRDWTENPPHPNPFRIFSHYLPLDLVSGDFYEVLAISESSVAVAIADVMGHGVQAALVTAMLRALIQDHRDLAAKPPELLATLNRSLCDILEGCRSATFVSVFAAVAEADARKLRFSNAGHPTPILLKRHGKTVVTVDGDPKANGGVLGVNRGAAFHAGEMDLEAGDLVLLFTDGLFEIGDGHGEILGAEGLKRLAAELIDRPGDCLPLALLEAARAHSAQGRFDDDVCLLGLELRETGQR